jgi:hypothetical protein
MDSHTNPVQDDRVIVSLAPHCPLKLWMHKVFVTCQEHTSDQG